MQVYVQKQYSIYKKVSWNDNAAGSCSFSTTPIHDVKWQFELFCIHLFKELNEMSTVYLIMNLVDFSFLKVLFKFFFFYNYGYGNDWLQVNAGKPGENCQLVGIINIASHLTTRIAIASLRAHTVS